jgi:hypothetical protein
MIYPVDVSRARPLRSFSATIALVSRVDKMYHRSHLIAGRRRVQAQLEPLGTAYSARQWDQTRLIHQ